METRLGLNPKYLGEDIMVLIRLRLERESIPNVLVSTVLFPYALGAKMLNKPRNKRWWKRPWLVTRMAFTIFLLLTFHYSEHEQEETTNKISLKQGLVTLAQNSIHQLPRETQDTKL